MASNNKILNDAIRKKFLEKICFWFEDYGEEVLVTGSGEIAIPCVDDEGNEKWVQVVVKVPSGSRDGEAYDGYSMAEDFQMKQEEKRIKAEEAAKKKAEKIAKDEASRKAKAEAKAKREVSK